MGRSFLKRTSAHQQTPISHSPSHGRIPEVDVLRGFALFGVFLVNLFAFGGDASAWSAPIDQIAWTLKHLLFESKFWGLFSLLFGISCWLQWRDNLSWLTATRRFLVLFIFGIGNALLFEGDILMLYAQLGFLLLILHRLPARWLLVIALALFLVFPTAHTLYPDRGEPDYPKDPIEAGLWLEEDREEGIYVADTLVEIIAWHAEALPEVPWADYQWPDSGLVVLAMFLLGFVMARTGWLERCLEKDSGAGPLAIRYWCVGLFLMVGERWLSISQGYRAFGEAIPAPVAQLMGDLVFAGATLALVVAWFLSVLLLARRFARLRIVKAMGAVGRMSLTMYLLQTLVIVLVFYGSGLGLAYALSPAKLLPIAVVVYLLQLWLASQWFHYFQVGPMEWLWRWGSDGHRRPLRAVPPPG